LIENHFFDKIEEMKAHIKKQSTIFGCNQYIKNGKAGSFTPGLSILNLEKHQYTFETGKAEVFILILAGEIEISVEGISEVFSFKRKSVFEDLPSGLYVSPEKKVFVQAISDTAEAAICFSSDLYLGKNEDKKICVQKKNIRKEDVKTVGNGYYKRNVTAVCGINNETYSLIVGETISDGGMWSSYPPHKHEKSELPLENKLKEIYYYRINPPQGFAFQGIYSDVSGKDSAYIVRDGDAVFISNGFHPVSAAPGYNLFYLWVLCGQIPEVAWKVDEKHKWMEKS